MDFHSIDGDDPHLQVAAGFEGELFPVRFSGGPNDGDRHVFLDVPLRLETVYFDGPLQCRVAYNRQKLLDEDGTTVYEYNDYFGVDIVGVLN